MKCMVCGSPRTEDISACPACGFPYIKTVGRDPRSERMLHQFAARYLQETLGQTELFLKIYGYRRSPEGLEFVREELLPLASYMALRSSEIMWNPKRFAKIRSSKEAPGSAPELKLEVLVRNKGRSAPVIAKVTPPLTEGDWQIGISRVREGVIALHAGNPGTSAASDEIDLFACPVVRDIGEKGGVST